MRLHRLLGIIMLLDARGVMKSADLAKILETSERTIYRDMNILCEAGIPICSVPGPTGGFSFCAEVDSFEDITEGMEGKVVPEGRYAVYTYCGDLKNLGEFYNSIFTKWMPDSGHEMDCRPQLELYDHRFMENGEFDIYMPIK